MSAGSPHRRLNEKHWKELDKLLAEPTAAAMMQVQPQPVYDYDINDVGGYPVMAHGVRYLDRFFVQAVRAGGFTDQHGRWVHVIVPGMTPDQVLHAVLIHEWIEKILLDADNDIDLYPDAHEFATCAEHQYVISLGAKPVDYEAMLHPLIKACELRRPEHVPHDYSCAPLLDDPNETDKHILAELQALGVPDSFKVSKTSVNYGRAKSAKQCINCAHWKLARNVDLSPCEGVSGAVRRDRVCSQHSPMTEQAGGRAGRVEQGNSLTLPQNIPGSVPSPG